MNLNNKTCTTLALMFDRNFQQCYIPNVSDMRNQLRIDTNTNARLRNSLSYLPKAKGGILSFMQVSCVLELANKDTNDVHVQFFAFLCAECISVLIRCCFTIL